MAQETDLIHQLRAAAAEVERWPEWKKTLDARERSAERFFCDTTGASETSSSRSTDNPDDAR
jgi:hypothetical protein